MVDYPRYYRYGMEDVVLSLRILRLLIKPPLRKGGGFFSVVFSYSVWRSVQEKDGEFFSLR